MRWRSWTSACAAVGARTSARVEPWARLLRATIRLARDDVPGATADATTAVDLARTRRERSLTEATFVTRALVAVANGELDLARALVEELGIDLVARNPVNGTSFLALVEELGLVDEYLRAAEQRETDHRPWIHAAAHFLRGDYSRAADVYASMGNRTDEAYARLRAAGALLAEGRRSEADPQLQRALGFYRSVGATRFIREGEALLAETA